MASNTITPQQQQQQQHARIRTTMLKDFQQGRPVEGLSEELGKISKTVESTLREKGSGPESSVADVLETQRRLVEEKDLANRFMRIKKRMEELQKLSGEKETKDFAGVQRQIESLRPLVMLIIRSSEFRDLMSNSLTLAKNLIKRNKQEGGEDKIKEKTKQEGVAEGAAEAKRQAQQTGQNIKMQVEKERLLTDEEWRKLSEKMDVTFRSLQKHSRYRDGLDQLFDLGSSLREQFNKSTSLSKREEQAVKEVKEEAIGIVSEFSGEKEINNLVDMINSLYEKFQNNERINSWWEDFKNQSQKIAKSYKGQEDLERYRKLFNEGYQIFDKFSDDISKVIDQMIVVVDNITNDKFIKELRERVGSISDELVWRDRDGNPHIDASAAKSLAVTITEAMQKEFKYLALPSIRHQDGDTTLNLTDMIVTASLPDNVSFHLESYANFNLKSFNLSKPGRPDLGNEIYLTANIENITFEMRNTHFDYQGTLITDSGTVSLLIPKPGAKLTIDFVLRPFKITDKSKSANLTGTEEKFAVSNAQGRYSLAKVKTNLYVPDLQVDFCKESMAHPYLLPTLTSLFKSSIIGEFEGIVEKLLNDGLVELGEKVAKILNEAPNPLSLSSLGEKGTE